MAKRLIVAVCLLAAGITAGCQRPARSAEAAPKQEAAAAAPAFEATLWDGTAVRGPAVWLEDGTVVVGGRRLGKGDIRLIQRASEGASGAVEISQLPEGFKPLSDAEIAGYRKRAEDAGERYKGSDSVLCLDKGENILRPDGTQVYRYHALFMVLKDSGRGVANISVGFQEGRGRAQILFARTVLPDGASQWSEQADFSVSVPPQAAQFVDTRTRVLSGQAPGVAVGALVEYAYEEEDYNPEVKDFFFPGYIFQSTRPVLDSVLDILVPKGRPLNFATRNMPEASAKPQRSDRGDYDCYRWEMRDVAPIVPEPFMPAESDVLAHMESSLYFDWKKLMAVTGGFQKERLQPNDEVKRLADEITKGRTTDDEKVAAIYHWVERNITYLSVKASLSSGWAGHPASETLKDGYGDCTDVSILAAALCRSVGVDAYPAIIKTNDAGEMMTEIPVPDGNHAITLVYPNGQPRFIDATAQDYRYPYFRSDDHGVKALIQMKDEIMDVPIPPPDDNMRESRQEITLLPDGGAKIVERNDYNGSYEAGVRGFWRSVPPELRGRMMQQYLQQRAPGALLDGFDLGDMEDLDKQLKMQIDYRLPVMATKMGDLYIFTLPNFAQKFPEASLEKRTFDVFTETTQCYRTSVVVFLPEGYELAGAPEGLSIKGKHLSFEGSVRLSDDKRALVAEQVFKRLTNLMPVADYGEYRKEAAAISAWTDIKIVLRKTAGTENKEAGK
jgi:transglutaminase-like putative cysteine protease